MTVSIHGYPARLSTKAGETLDIMLSVEGAEEARTELVRIVHCDEHPAGPGYSEESVPGIGAGRIAVRSQPTQKGNFLRIADPQGRLSGTGAFTIHALVQPTMLGREMTVMGKFEGRSGFGLVVAPDGTLEYRVGGDAGFQTLRTDVPLRANVWYFVAASFDPGTGAARLTQTGVVNRYNSRYSRVAPLRFDAAAETTFAVPARLPRNAPFIIGGAQAEQGVVAHFSGKIDRAGYCAGMPDANVLAALSAGAPPPADTIVAYWDPSVGYTDRGIGDIVRDTGPYGLDGIGVNRPVRGQTGWNWSGRNDCYRLAPGEYGGVEYHHDALTDCCWEPSLTLDLPATLRSGAYALKVSAEAGGKTAEDYVVFFVRPAVPKASICFLVPTASYLAYANCRCHMEGDASQVVLARVPVFQKLDIDETANDQLFGLSTYDCHADGAGVCYTSARRPLFTMHPKYRVPGVDCAWQFQADMSVTAFLEAYGYDYDILTDEDLDREGVEALLPYKLVINGTHCEYYSERMLDATEDYLERGGRITYLAGNGYYWVVAFRPDEPGIMEVRKLDAGSRAWQARPGECYLATTGERSGLWRLRGRPPQKIVATGFASEGMDRSFPYERLPDSYDPSVSWIFEGVDETTIGDFGLAHDGAVGLEIDRCDSRLGTPPNTRILASSGPLTENWQLVTEDVMFMHPGMGGDEHPLVRCDMAYFETRGGGAVFSPSSIAWGSALPVNGFDNNVARIMRNVVDRFISDDPALWPNRDTLV